MARQKSTANVSSSKAPTEKDEPPLSTSKRSRTTAASTGSGSGSGSGPGSGKVKRGKAGKLKNLPEMPLDILFEVFSHLKPLDLLHLAWTTKDLRAVLMRRSAISVWKVSLARIEGMPPCPPDMTEVQWVHLTFYAHCHFCDAANTKTIYWTCRLRTCTKCLKDESNFMEINRFDHFLYRWSYKSVAPTINGPTSRRGTWNSFFLPQTTYQLLRAKAQEFNGDRESEEQFVKERTELMATLYEHARLCEEWRTTVCNARSEELDELRKSRSESIFSRLRELGWGDELDRVFGSAGFYTSDDVKSITNHPLVKKPQLLTEKVWKNVQGPLEELLQKMKSKRMEIEHSNLMYVRQKLLLKLLQPYIASIPGSDFIPVPADFACMDAFRTILECPDDVDLNEASFVEPMSRLPALADELRRCAIQQLLDLAPMAIQELDLSLATVFFSCRSCKKSIAFPGILAHPCMTSPYVSSRDLNLLCPWRLDGLPWNYGGEQIVFGDQASKAACHFIIISGSDPNTTTTEEMDNKDCRFECVRCAKGEDRLVMTWRYAIVHVLEHHGGDVIADDWAVLSERDAVMARAQDLRSFVDQLRSPRLYCFNLHCMVCMQRFTSLQGLVTHSANRHPKAHFKLQKYGDLNSAEDVDLNVPPIGPIRPLRITL